MSDAWKSEIAAILRDHPQVGGTHWDQERKTTFAPCQCGVRGYLAGSKPTHEEHVAEIIASRITRGDA